MDFLIGLCASACLEFMQVDKAINYEINEIPRTVSLVYKDHSRMAWYVKYTDKCTNIRPIKGEAIVGDKRTNLCVAFNMDHPIAIGFDKGGYNHYHEGGVWKTKPKSIKWHMIYYVMPDSDNFKTKE